MAGMIIRGEVVETLLTVRGAAEVLAVDPSTVRKWINSGLLSVVWPKSGPDELGSPLLTRKEVLRMLEARRAVGRG